MEKKIKLILNANETMGAFQSARKYNSERKRFLDLVIALEDEFTVLGDTKTTLLLTGRDSYSERNKEYTRIRSVLNKSGIVDAKSYLVKAYDDYYVLGGQIYEGEISQTRGLIERAFPAIFGGREYKDYSEKILNEKYKEAGLVVYSGANSVERKLARIHLDGEISGLRKTPGVFIDTNPNPQKRENFMFLKKGERIEFEHSTRDDIDTTVLTDGIAYFMKEYQRQKCEPENKQYQKQDDGIQQFTT